MLRSRPSTALAAVGIGGTVDVVHGLELVVDQLDERRSEPFERLVVTGVGEPAAQPHHPAVGLPGELERRWFDVGIARVEHDLREVGDEPHDDADETTECGDQEHGRARLAHDQQQFDGDRDRNDRRDGTLPRPHAVATVSPRVDRRPSWTTSSASIASRRESSVIG